MGRIRETVPVGKDHHKSKQDIMFMPNADECLECLECLERTEQRQTLESTNLTNLIELSA